MRDRGLEEGNNSERYLGDQTNRTDMDTGTRKVRKMAPRFWPAITD